MNINEFLSAFSNIFPPYMPFEKILEKAAVARVYADRNNGVHPNYLMAATSEENDAANSTIRQKMIEYKNSDRQLQMKFVAKYIVGVMSDISMVYGMESNEKVSMLCSDYFMKKSGEHDPVKVDQIMNDAAKEVARETADFIAESLTKMIHERKGDLAAGLAAAILPPSVKSSEPKGNVGIYIKALDECLKCADCIQNKECKDKKVKMEDCDALDTMCEALDNRANIEKVDYSDDDKIAVIYIRDDVDHDMVRFKIAPCLKYYRGR